MTNDKNIFLKIDNFRITNNDFYKNNYVVHILIK